MTKYFLLLFLLSTALAGCNTTPREAAMTACEHAFDMSTEANRVGSCRQGVIWGDQNMYVAHQSVVPSLQEFRGKYRAIKAWCQSFKADLEAMACIDGLDAYSALLADSAGYSWRDYNDETLPSEYYANHTYFDLYDDMDDNRWLFYLMHRHTYPEYYPGYRRDQYYTPYTSISGPYPFVPHPWGIYHPYIFMAPHRTYYNGTAWVNDSTTVYWHTRTFGPRAAPRPYLKGTWSIGQRPGMPNGTAPGKFLPSTSGTRSIWGKSGQGTITRNFQNAAGVKSIWAASPSKSSGGGITSRGGFGSGGGKFSGGGAGQ